jgi:hypothetical protein
MKVLFMILISELAKNTEMNSKYISIEGIDFPKSAKVGDVKTTKIRFAAMVEQVRFEAYSDDDEEPKVKPAIMGRGSSLGSSTSSKSKTSESKDSRNSDRQQRTKNGGSSRNTDRPVAESPIPPIMEKRSVERTIFDSPPGPDKRINFNPPRPEAAENQPKKIVINQPTQTITQTTTNEDEERIKILELQLVAMKTENEKTKKLLKQSQTELEETMLEKDKVIECMDSQKAKFDKLSGTVNQIFNFYRLSKKSKSC